MLKPIRKYTSIELFAGAGGLALGLENAGFNTLMLNEIDKNACKTLEKNRTNWNILQGDIKNIDFSVYKNVDLLAGGFPCQAFSYAGKKLGFDDNRGALFFEFARALKTIRPRVFLAENVRGLLTDNKGKTFETVKESLESCGYTLVHAKVLKAMLYKVPQKRERLILIGVRNDLINENITYKTPETHSKILTLKDALYKGDLYPSDVPNSKGQKYSKNKYEIMQKVPQGGYWKDLPIALQKSYMKGSYNTSGGKTGMARRLSLNEPSLTLTTSPAQKQTERCHPIETRPLTTREYARIQTFPDDWEFCGSLTSVYKQIGNAVPVNFATALGRSLVRLLNDLEQYT